MTYSEFLQACNDRSIYPGIAAENEKITQALRDKNDAEVLRLLDEEF